MICEIPSNLVYDFMIFNFLVFSENSLVSVKRGFEVQTLEISISWLQVLLQAHSSLAPLAVTGFRLREWSSTPSTSHCQGLARAGGRMLTLALVMHPAIPVGQEAHKHRDP